MTAIDHTYRHAQCAVNALVAAGYALRPDGRWTKPFNGLVSAIALVDLTYDAGRYGLAMTFE